VSHDRRGAGMNIDYAASKPKLQPYNWKPCGQPTKSGTPCGILINPANGHCRHHPPKKD
jgi:hypothetical protein